MAKFFGMIGYGISTEVRSGVWEDQITERPYHGELLKNRSNRQGGDGVNDNINIAHEISILSDPFANEHFSAMKYVSVMGAKWKITNVEVSYPRLILTTGGVYNG